MKRIDIDGKSFRLRRGKLVEIPPEWLGRFTTDQHLRDRPSRLHGKLKKVVKDRNCTIFKDKRDALGLKAIEDFTGECPACRENFRCYGEPGCKRAEIPT